MTEVLGYCQTRLTALPAAGPARRVYVNPAFAFVSWLACYDFTVTRIEKLVGEVLRGTSDSGIRFEELQRLLLHLGFAERSRRSHFVFTRAGVEERINLQRDGSHAKAYQVKRVVILKYHLAEK